MVTLVGLTGLHIRPDGTVSVRLMTPANPFSEVTAIVEVAWVFTFADGEDAEMVKSVIRKIAVVECASVPLVPVRVSV